MVYEVICRYVLNRPNLWSHDVSYMLAGTLFYLGAAYTLKEKAHVIVDFLSAHFPPAVKRRIDVAFYACAFLPVLAWISASTIRKAWLALIAWELNYTSPWAPVMWPFYGTIAIGLVLLWLQAAALLVSLLHTRFDSPNGVPHAE
jgi:TRAP-type C4-dicarboxylate transport system permease small subunit